MNRLMRAVAVFLLLTPLACGSDSGPTPSDPLASATLKVDGQSFTPSPKGMSALDRTGGVTDIQISNCAGTSIILSVSAPFVVGVHPISRINQAALFNQNGSQQWDYVKGQGRGTLTFTSTSPRLVGTYAFDVSPLGTTGPSRFMEGAFDVTYGNGTSCQ